MPFLQNFYLADCITCYLSWKPYMVKISFRLHDICGRSAFLVVALHRWYHLSESNASATVYHSYWISAYHTDGGAIIPRSYICLLQFFLNSSKSLYIDCDIRILVPCKATYLSWNAVSNACLLDLNVRSTKSAKSSLDLIVCFHRWLLMSGVQVVHKKTPDRRGWGRGERVPGRSCTWGLTREPRSISQVPGEAQHPAHRHGHEKAGRRGGR